MDEYLVFKAIGDRVRIDILKFLSGGEKSVGEVVAINVNTVEIANGLSGLDAWEE
ncbi:MAG: hypothetical protein GY771_13255 [bacterium]|nr:hypothetical protein [bacterium]